MTFLEFETSIESLKLYFKSREEVMKSLEAFLDNTVVLKFDSKFIEDFISLLSIASGISAEWLEWFIWENEFGKREHKAGFEEKYNVIKDSKDFWNIFYP